jgi:hypothetical protein
MCRHSTKKTPVVGCEISYEDRFSAGVWEEACWDNSLHGESGTVDAMSLCRSKRYTLFMPPKVVLNQAFIYRRFGKYHSK